MEGSGQEWWEGTGREAALHLGVLSGSRLQVWLNNRMLYENKHIICLLKGQERPCNWLSKESSAIPTSKEIGMYQHSDTKPIKRMFFFPH